MSNEPEQRLDIELLRSAWGADDDAAIKTVILAGGKGTRLKRRTRRCCRSR